VVVSGEGIEKTFEMLGLKLLERDENVRVGAICSFESAHRFGEVFLVRGDGRKG
jgi:hypothetical protein